MPGKPAEDAENELDIRGCFVPCGLGSCGLLAWDWRFVNRAGVYFFCSSGVELDGDSDRPTVNMLGGYYSQQQFLRTWMSVQTWLLPTNHRSWTKP